MTQLPHNLRELLETDRELTGEERAQLMSVGQQEWAAVHSTLITKAKAVYSVADHDSFNACVFQHMDANDRTAMVVAEVYECPGCGRLLKDRRSPVASSILLERKRLRTLWMNVEDADEAAMPTALRTFRRALGVHDPVESPTGDPIEPLDDQQPEQQPQ